tara:strand:- start:1781 stop:2224 length:444 start_codon:yes stop_codon:yes gene_type:complete
MSLLSSSEKAQIQTAYESFFETFKNDIVVHKVSEIVVSDVNLDQVFGYEEDANENNYTYEHKSKTFSALIVFPSRGDQTLGVMNEMAAQIPDGEIRVKVKEDCKNYIQTGKTEKIVAKNKSYQLISTEAEVNNILTGFYIFKLKEVK